jgi:beta-glucosidase
VASVAVVATATLTAATTSARAASIPYRLPVRLPTSISSPPVDAAAPYTPLVRSLIKQLEPDSPPTLLELMNAAKVFQGLLGYIPAVASCHGVGVVSPPAGTRPAISPLCWADSVGVNLISGPNSGRTTATAEPLAIGSTFDLPLANAWGQVEGIEGRRTMVTGLYGPEADVSLYTNWERGLDTTGEDPLLAGEMAAAQVDGIQGRGIMAQVKHFAAFAGSDRYLLAQYSDQAMHEMLMAPFERSFTQAQAASTMCSYQLYQVRSTHLPGPVGALDTGVSPYAAGLSPKTWPLGERHWACEQPYALDYVLRGMWHWTGFVGSDYPAIHSTAAMAQGAAQEFPSPYFFAATDPLLVGIPVATAADAFGDPTGDTCAVVNLAASCSARGARHVSGIPGPVCNPTDGCGLVDAVFTGAMPLSIFNQALAEILYEQQRFGLLGCNDVPRSATCTNPGGVSGDRSGNAPVPAGPRSGATPSRDLGTEAGDAAVVERMAEEGAVLLKNAGRALPLRPRGSVLVTGAGAEYLIGAPSNEASTGFPERIAINPLEQLKALSGRPAAFQYIGANGVTGQPVPSSVLSTANRSVTGGLQRSSGPGSPGTDPTLDFTKVSGRGQLAAGGYRWTGYLYVPRDDAYTFRFQYSPGTGNSATGPVTFSLDGLPQQLSTPPSTYCGQYYGHSVCVPVTPTNAGYTEGGLANRQVAAGVLHAGYHRLQIGFENSSSEPASFRFAYSRRDGDISDAAAAARGAARAIVFADDNGVKVVDQDAETPPDRQVSALADGDVRLIDAVAAANANTIVVLNTADPVIVEPWADNPHVKAILEMWNSGSEGGTATARLLLGQANPSGHTSISWPRQGTDTWWSGRPERLNGATDENQADCLSAVPPALSCHKTVMSQGIFTGYRFYDAQRLLPEFPFGFGLSYTRFRFSRLAVRGHRISFTVRNVGRVVGAEVGQVYVGPGPAVPGVQQAVRTLAGFARLSLGPGRSRRVTITLDERSFQYWDELQQRWHTDRGSRRIWVGDADARSHLPLTARVRA